MFMGSIAFERIPPEGHHVGLSPELLGISGALLALLMVDNIILVLAYSSSAFYARSWNRTYTAVLASQVLSMTLCHSVPFVWLRAGRVLLVLCKLERFQPTVLAILRTFPRVFTVLLIYAVVVSFYAILGQLLFGNLYKELDIEYTNAFQFSTSKQSEIIRFLRSFVSLFVLTTTENYPGIMYPALLRGNPIVALLFFGSFCILLLYLVMNVVLAATYDGWKNEHSHQLLRLRVVRYHNLLVAWQVLLDEGTTLMSIDRWCELVGVLKPSVSFKDMRQMFFFMDKDRSGGITRTEFILHACDALRFDFQRWRRKNELLRRRDTGFLCLHDVVISDSKRHFLQRLIRSPWFQLLLYLTITLNTVLMASRRWNDKDEVFSIIPPEWEVALSLLISVILVAEQGIKFLVFPPLECWPFRAHCDLVLSLLCIIGTWGSGSRPSSAYQTASHETSAGFQVLSVCRILLLLRFLTTSNRVVKEISTTWRIRFPLLNFIFIFLLVIYTYACVGVSLMHGLLPARTLYDGDPGETWVDDASVGQSIVNMNNYGDCFLALMQISVDNNWQDILWANTIQAGPTRFRQFMIGVYFCSFFVLMGWFGLNILTALVIETYDVAKARAEQEESRRKREAGQPTDAAPSSGPGLLQDQSLGGCMRCGEAQCAVFVPSRFDPNMCQCGHAALYHMRLPSRANPPPRVARAQHNAASAPDGQDYAEEDDNELFQAGWSAFQQTKGLELTEEVPQYRANFNAREDLQNIEVMTRLRHDMNQTAERLKQTHLTMKDQFRSLLRRRGIASI